MDKLFRFKKLNHDDILLYSLLAIVITTTITFLSIYMLWVPFWPARLVHIIYLSFNVSLIYFLKKKKYLFVKISILIANLIQLSLASFLWFPLTTKYQLFYFLLPMGSFAILDVLDKKERAYAMSISFTSLILFFLNSYMNINFYIYEISEFATRIISFLTVTSTMGILAIYFYLHAYFLAQKKLELEYLANTDSLTDIYNRRNFYTLSELEFKLAHKYGHSFTLLLLDIDHFKNINDTYGHGIGDQVLKQLSLNVKENIRQNDIFARHGGEEFTLLLRKTDLQTGILIAEKIRKSISEMKVETSSDVINVTVSIGVTEFSKECHALDQLVILADKALYEAKENGRNCVAHKTLN